MVHHATELYRVEEAKKEFVDWKDVELVTGHMPLPRAFHKWLPAREGQEHARACICINVGM